MRPKSNTRLETDDRQTDINEFTELYRKKVRHIISITKQLGLGLGQHSLLVRGLPMWISCSLWILWISIFRLTLLLLYFTLLFFTLLYDRKKRAAWKKTRCLNIYYRFATAFPLDYFQ